MITAMTNFQFVNANKLRETSWIRWSDTVLQLWVDCTKLPSSSTHTVKFIGNAIRPKQFWFLLWKCSF